MIKMRRLHDVTDELEAATPWKHLPGGGKVKLIAPEATAPGDFYWNLGYGRRSIVIAMPTVRFGGSHVCVEWAIRPYPGDRHKWTWDGDEDRPTLKPSLHWVGVWHGWVTNGVMVGV